MLWEISVVILVTIDVVMTIILNKKIAKREEEQLIVREIIMYKIETYESKDGYRFRIKAINGQIIAHSEAYSSKRSMMRTVRILNKDHNFEIVEEKLEQQLS